MPTNPPTGSARPDRPALEHKSLTWEVKSLDDNGNFVLYALAFGNVDRQGDLIRPGAVLNLPELVKDGWGALNHLSHLLPVAWIDLAEQDAHGLRIGGQFHSTGAAQDCRTVVRERMKAGKSVKCSIGYGVDDYEMERRDGQTIRILKGIRVYEFSFVNLPANPEAEVVSSKGLDERPPEDPEPEEMDDSEKGLIKALKRACGLESKRSVAISAANRAKIGEHMDAVEAAHGEMEKCHKEMKATHEKSVKAHKSACKALDDMKAYMKGFEPAATDEDEDDESPKPKKHKEADPEDTADGDPPKSAAPTQEQEDLKDLRDQLRTRALAGRAVQSCP